MELISAEARELLARPSAGATGAERQRLRREVTAPRRLVAGGLAVLLALVGGLAAAFTASEVAAGRLGDALGATGLALLMLVPAAVLGTQVVHAGRRVVEGYVKRCGSGPVVRPDELVGSVLGPGLVLRSALGAAGITGTCFAASVLWLGLVAGDVAGVALGAVWVLTGTIATWHLLAGELRVVRAESRRTRAGSPA